MSCLLYLPITRYAPESQPLNCLHVFFTCISSLFSMILMIKFMSLFNGPVCSDVQTTHFYLTKLVPHEYNQKQEIKMYKDNKRQKKQQL